MHQIPRIPIMWLAILVAPCVAAAQGGPGSVRGTVYDSLARRPLGGARVWVSGASGGATTADGGGRYRLANVPAGTAVIAFTHPDLDSIGLTSNTRRVRVASGAEAALDLALPSITTIRRSLCGDSTVRTGGVMFGSVADAGRDVRLAGVRVLLSWVAASRVRGGPLDVGRRSIEQRSDSLGNFSFCGMPTDEIVVLAASAGGNATGHLDVLVGSRGLLRRDLRLAIRDSGAAARGAVVRGRVVNGARLPLREARVTVTDDADWVASDDAGAYVLAGQPAGSQMITARLIGHAAVRVPVELRPGDTTTVDIVLHEMTALDTIRITSRRRNNQLDEIIARVRSGLGSHLSGDDARRSPSMRSLLQQLPEMSVAGSAGSELTIRRMRAVVSGSSSCVPALYVDGVEELEVNIGLIQPPNVIAVEWYPRSTGAPLRYMQVMQECGVLLIWTRRWANR